MKSKEVSPYGFKVMEAVSCRCMLEDACLLGKAIWEQSRDMIEMGDR